MPHRLRPTLSWLLAFVLLAAACGGDGDNGDELDQDVDTLLAASADVMGEVDTVRFAIERGGDPVYIDDVGLLEFKDAKGRFVAPDAADAVVKVGVSGLNVEIGAVAIEGSLWLSNPLTGDWELAPAAYAFDPTTLFDPEVGWRPLLAGELQNAEFVGREEGDDGARYHLTGTAPAARISTITAGLVSGQDVAVDLWIDPVTAHVLQVVFEADSPTGRSDWDLSFSDYGADIVITPPEGLDPGG